MAENTAPTRSPQKSDPSHIRRPARQRISICAIKHESLRTAFRGGSPDGHPAQDVGGPHKGAATGGVLTDDEVHLLARRGIRERGAGDGTGERNFLCVAE